VIDEDRMLRDALRVDDIPVSDAAFTSEVMLRVARRAALLRLIERLLAGVAVLVAAVLLTPLAASPAGGPDQSAVFVVSVGFAACAAFLLLWPRVERL
jgi:hypothetical protein